MRASRALRIWGTVSMEAATYRNTDHVPSIHKVIHSDIHYR